MAIQIGQHLGSLEITALLGKAENERKALDL
jgi:hypothetical protein